MYDLEEQEQIDVIKAWWKQYGNWVWVALLVAAIAFGGFRGWRYYQRTQAEKAGVLFDAIRLAAQQGDAAKTLQAAKVLQDTMPDSAMAVRGAFIGAAVSHGKGDDPAARQELEWVVAHAKEPLMADLGRLRLAGLLADEKQYDAALQLLAANRSSDLTALTQDLRGDILLAQGKPNEARAAYQGVVDGSKDGDVLHQVAQSKLEALGDSR